MGVYATLDDVKDVLLSGANLKSGGQSIDFSEAFRDLRPGSNNTGTIALSRVDFDDSYYGVADFGITFTSSTQFDVVMNPEGNRVAIPVGSGDVASVFTAMNNMVTPPVVMFVIQPSYWSGTAQTTAPDTIIFRSTSSISNVIGEKAIDDASFRIDGMILASRLVNNTDLTQLMFQPGAVPGLISKATKFLAAYYIWSVVHREADEAKSMVESWRQRAIAYTENYIRIIPRKGPGWYSGKAIIPTSATDQLGIPIFGTGGSAQQTIDEVVKRLREYSDSQNYLSVTFP